MQHGYPRHSIHKTCITEEGELEPRGTSADQCSEARLPPVS